MKIAICSDLHLEFGTISLENTDHADVLILSGDICVAKDILKKNQADVGFSNLRSEKIHLFFEECCARFPYVVYIFGNHEHYNGDFSNTFERIRDCLDYLPNLHILDKQVVTLGDITFIGGTLWTDMNREDSITLMHMTSMMNDFRCVTNSNRQVNYKEFVPVDKPVFMTDEEWLQQPTEARHKPVFKTRDAKFAPEDAVVDHREFLEYIKLIVEGKHDQKFVVCGHHAPSRASTHPRYKADEIMNGGYSSDLSEFILDRPQIKLWTHGHTHNPFDYVIGTTRIVCNPRGYIGYEQEADNFELKFVEV